MLNQYFRLLIIQMRRTRLSEIYHKISVTSFSSTILMPHYSGYQATAISLEMRKLTYWQNKVPNVINSTCLLLWTLPNRSLDREKKSFG